MSAHWRLSDRELALGQPLAVGIVNVTSDSMFAGARSGTPEQAVADGEAMVAAGFGMLDVGAVAARSGPPVSAEAEAAALIPALEGLRGCGAPLSADTFSPLVAAAALEAGAVAINDIGGGGEEMFDLVAKSGCGYVLMHIEGPPREDRPAPRYDDVVGHLKSWFAERIEAAVERGVAAEQIAIDPGLDFDLGVDDDLVILGRLEELHELGRPLYVSLSRKDFVGAILATARATTGRGAEEVAWNWSDRVEASGREWGTVAAVSLAVAAGAQILRLHDRSSLQALQVAGRIARAA
jgi:dihydropteroate synthase